MNMHHPALTPRSDAKLLCQPVKDWTGRLPYGGAIVEPKKDGIRVLHIPGQPTLVSREGSPIHGVEHIMEVMRRIELEHGPMFIEGEFVVDGSFDATIRHFKAGDHLQPAGTLHVFEALRGREWEGLDPTKTQEVRRGQLDELMKPYLCDAAQLVPWQWANNAADVERMGAEAIERGDEGIVVKHALSTYRRAHTSQWQRIKRVMTRDVVITGVVAREDRPDLVGALVGRHEGVTVRVAVGFTDKQRFDLMLQADSLPGQIMEVEAMEVTERGSLREARFVRLREDKA